MGLKVKGKIGFLQATNHKQMEGKIRESHTKPLAMWMEENICQK